MKKVIKIYGERNTNTNYISELIRLNLAVMELPGTVNKLTMKLQDVLPGRELIRDIYFKVTYGKNLGWKHQKVNTPVDIQNSSIWNTREVALVSISKNPYSWLLSLYRRPYHQYFDQNVSFEEFIQRPWKTIGRDNMNEAYVDPVELWNVKNKSYLELPKLNGLNITTEAIFADSEKIIELISSHFSINRRSNIFLDYQRSTKGESKTSDYYRQYYLNESWRKDISKEAYSIIRERVDDELMAYYGYDH
jgi:hypothetical protein